MKTNSVRSFILYCSAGLILLQTTCTLKVFAQEEVTAAGAGVQVKEPATNVDNRDETISTVLALEPAKRTIALPHEYSLNNGLKIILLEDKAYPFVSCFSWYKVGSRDDPAGMTGLTHLVEHLLFQNIGSFAGNQWANTVVRNGGEFSGFTSEDFTAFYSNLPSYQLELAIRGEAERMRDARFNKDDVEKEVQHLVKEAEAEEQDLVQMLNREVHALAYEKHPYRNPPGGWHNELERLTYAEAKAHYDRFFHPNNATLVVVGGFDEQVVLNLIQKYFGSLPKAEALPNISYPQERPQLAERQVKLKARSGKESIILAYKVSGFNDADAPTIAVLEQLLDGQSRGGLRAKLIESGLCTSLQASFEQKRDPGLLVINCGGIPVNGSVKLVQAIDAYMSKLKAKALSESDLKQIVRQTEFAFYSDGDGPYGSGFQLGFFSTLSRGELAYVWPQKIRKVSAEDILRVSRRYLNEENRVQGQIAIANANQETGNSAKKIDLSLGNDLGKDHFSIAFQANNTLANTLNNGHFRLATYQNGNLNPYLLAEANSVNSVNPVSSVNAAKKESPAIANDLHKSLTPQIKCKVLRSGLRVYVLESHLKPLVQVCGSLKAGAIYEQPNNRGLSQLLATLLNFGDTKTNKQQLIAKQSDLGLPPQAMLQFDSNVENISFRTNCLSKDYIGQMRQLFSCLRDPRLQSADLEAAKSDASVLLRQNDKKVDTRIERALLRNLIAANSIYYPIYPEDEISSIANFKLNDLADFYYAHVNPGSTNIVVCGDVDSEEVFALCEQLSEGWYPATQNSAISPVPNVSVVNQNAAKVMRPEGLIISNHSATKSSLILPQLNPAEIVLSRIIPVNNLKQTENYWAAMLITDCALSGHPISSRVSEQFALNPQLFDESTEEGWDSKVFKMADKLIWSLRINLKPQSTSSAAVTAIQKELTEFSKCGLRQEEVVEAKRYLTGNIPVKDCFNLEGLNQFIFRGINELNQIEPVARIQRIINSMKYEDVNEFIARIFKPHLASVVVAGPKDLIKQVRQSGTEGAEANSD